MEGGAVTLPRSVLASTQLQLPATVATQQPGGATWSRCFSMADMPLAISFIGGAAFKTFSGVRRHRARQRAKLGVRVAPIVEKQAAAEASTSIPPILVVNLDRSPDRWKNCQEEFVREGLNVDRFPATDGKAMSTEAVVASATTSAKYFCTPGMIGCFLSHQRIWQKVVDEQLPAAVVFEDDVRLYPDFEPRLKECMAELPASGNDKWDVCLLGAVACANHPIEPWYMKYYSFLIGGGRASPGKSRLISDHVFVPHRPAGTHAYMVSQAGAQKLLEALPKAQYHVDLSAWALQSLNLYAVKDFLATQAFEETSTVSKGKSRSKAMLNWLWDISGFSYMARRGGIEHLAWAWKAAIFALPLPGGKIPIGMGASSSIFLIFLVIAAILRSRQVVGIAIAYEGLVCSAIRYLCGTWSNTFTLLHAAAAAALIFV
mmetsp:Transcript_52893/g.123798  ORF Transcript_52893/g.123798 Transcript_52893/m.123798 type:complete len:431 (-) Transcript_52893:16-1308(-)